MTEQTKQTRIFWSPEEKAVLCKQAALALFNLQVMRKLDALEVAQKEVLPAERQRKVLQLSASFQWFEEGLQAELEVLKQQRLSPPPAAAPVPPEPAEPPSLDLLWPLLRQKLVDEAASFLSDVLAKVEIPAELKPILSQEPGDGVQVARHAVAAARTFMAQAGVSAATATRKPSVLVVGLKGGQMEAIRQELGNYLDLRFFGVHESKDKLRFMSGQVDHVVAVTDFISHSHEEICVSKARDYIRSSGGMTRLKEVLRGVLAKAQATEPV